MNEQLEFFFDPVCPFAWMTSRWVRTVRSRRDLDVEWRFISLWQLNSGVDYASHFPPEYPAMHTAGLRLLRVASAAREIGGGGVVGELYDALGNRIHEVPRDETRPGGWEAAPELVEAALREVGLPGSLVAALDEEFRDAEIQAETDRALELAGRDVGTPILHFGPPDGVAFFGPVISRLPGPEEAVELWEHVVGLARFQGFAELKRSLRERPQLPSFGVRGQEVGRTEDWHGGSRRLKR